MHNYISNCMCWQQPTKAPPKTVPSSPPNTLVLELTASPQSPDGQLPSSESDKDRLTATRQPTKPVQDRLTATRQPTKPAQDRLAATRQPTKPVQDRLTATRQPTKPVQDRLTATRQPTKPAQYANYTDWQLPNSRQ